MLWISRFLGGVLLKNACSVTWLLRVATGHIPMLEIHIPKLSCSRWSMADKSDDYSSGEFSSDEEVSAITTPYACYLF